MRVDLLTLYAYSDKTHTHQRELWRGFLALVFPVLLEFDAGEFERLVENAHCRSVEALLRATDSPESVSEFLWTASGQFAESLGFEAELGLSAFLDVDLPTRIHSIQTFQNSVNKNDSLISEWLQAFRKIQQSPEFLEITAEWKRVFELFAEDGTDLIEEQSVSMVDTVEAETAQRDQDFESAKTSPQAPVPTSTLRKERRRQPRRKSG